ncbi:DUF5677 domain-containing protein [Pedobacter sp. Du54]|uniref:DUF5677 domain-containing protein n=1 Tax=Pedobacter anseongensis TaxID=3133439 RepID=UPI00309D10F3
MNKDELRAEFTRLRIMDSEKNINDVIDILLEYFLKSIQNHRSDKNTPTHLHDAMLINQMLFTKLAHLKQLISGIEFVSKDGSRLKKIVDPTVVASLVRTIFETVGMFNLIYISNNSDEEMLIKYNLWVIAGLSYRQRFVQQTSSPENIQKAKDELAQIGKLKAQIESTALFKALSQRDKDKIYEKINRKEYNVIFENGHVKGIAGFQEFIANAGFNPKLMDNMYTHFSLNSHPSNVAVFQFGDMFQNKDPRFFELASFNVKNAIFLLSVFIADYIRLFPDVANTYSGRPIIDQIMINFFNAFMRGHEYDINNAYEHLN